jgi:hypothetical protein
MSRQLVVSLCIVAMAASLSCKKTGTPQDEAEHEAINGIDLVFKVGGSTVATITAEDPDGDGGNPPTRIDRITLQPGQTYTTEVVLRNIINGTSKVVTSSVTSQAVHHEFFYLPSGVAVNITKTDKDSNGYPLGINATWTTTTSGSGTLLFKLMHKPRIKGPNDDPSKGHSDVSISFPMTIQ